MEAWRKCFHMPQVPPSPQNKTTHMSKEARRVLFPVLLFLWMTNIMLSSIWELFSHLRCVKNKREKRKKGRNTEVKIPTVFAQYFLQNRAKWEYKKFGGIKWLNIMLPYQWLSDTCYLPPTYIVLIQYLFK